MLIYPLFENIANVTGQFLGAHIFWIFPANKRQVATYQRAMSNVQTMQLMQK